MNTLEKFKILAESAKYDVSCSSSGAKRKNKLGMTVLGGICHSWSSDGRCISLLKILMTNVCIYDCAYCVNRRSNDIPRATFEPRELIDLTVDFYEKNYIEGLFLSSAVIKTPDYTMERMIEIVRQLRGRRQFGGYIHLKIIPGTSPRLLEIAGRYADRVSVNIELPTQKSLALLAPDKKMPEIIGPMKRLDTSIRSMIALRKKHKKVPAYAPAGQSTQLIIGATPETDLEIMGLSQWLYQSIHLKRVYYSAYVPVNTTKNLPALTTAIPLLREHRLYQADWLIRFYGFDGRELFTKNTPHLDLEVDPKASWALRHPEKFPVEINRADYETLIRVPGIGVQGAYKIVLTRQVKSLRIEDLKKMRISLKRAQYFITVKGKYHGDIPFTPEDIRERLAPEKRPALQNSSPQLNFFIQGKKEEIASVLHGEF
ncbi:MAG: putative DNA modification/repair radical SAM protein [Candidatus Omnitrophica bacterium]|nr:putative DNA modification/repair radical SAM protein [Candidatus Omnitrophota bacterium]